MTPSFLETSLTEGIFMIHNCLPDETIYRRLRSWDWIKKWLIRFSILKICASNFQNWSQNAKASRGPFEIEIDAYINLDH
jgi:hypothetical protein